MTMTGTLDVTDMTQSGQVAVIGLTDADALRAGDRGDKADNGIYLARQSRPAPSGSASPTAMRAAASSPSASSSFRPPPTP